MQRLLAEEGVPSALSQRIIDLIREDGGNAADPPDQRFLEPHAGGSGSQERADGELELLKTSIDTAPDGAYWFDPDGRFVYVNDAGCRVLGYTREELYALQVHDINPRATPERWSDVWRALKEQKRVTLESEHRRKDGSLFPVEVSCTYIVSGGKEYCNGYAVDVTERKRSEKQREALQAQLGQAQKMESIGRLAGGVAHDFNNMLTVILGHVELGLSEAEPGSAVACDLVEIRSAAKRAAELTGQLLAFARLQTVAPKVLDLNANIADMLNVLGRLIGEEIELRWQPGEVWPVSIDPVQIYQILANLCLNARDAIDGVGTIDIQTDTVTLSGLDRDGRVDIAAGEYVRLSVRDDGGGVSEAVMAHLFEPFFTTKEPGRGTGLGLATVYGIVTQNGGSIDVQSQVGAGTIFRVHLPKHLGQLESGQRQASRLEGGGETVLLVEDEPAILRVERDILERLGYRVLSANTPSEAIRLAEDRSLVIALLISDVVMPEMNGRELSAWLSALRPGLQTLFVSGYPADVIARHGVLESGFYFLQKPFTVQQIADAIGAALASRRIASRAG